MGFLKELFQKKLQDAASAGDALEVGQRVHSDFTLQRTYTMARQAGAGDACRGG